ncbi:D-alanyl-D-alanine carboxypeptidase family protein [Aedoeadaptatus coxii]|uniref:D-alanyl-D-alanine carboxypeptidase family protein n=1 Tax=Aedoeadaptatus coxii TaxID=755172 RepID=UPI002AD4887E|nr:D-alanyl-D-alanine carboxypeptidase family protein [Peptoniphilus coxii]
MKLLKRSVALLLAAILLMGAAPPAPNGEGENAPPQKVEEPRDQKEKIHTAKGVLPMTATEKKAFDEAMAKPEAALLKSYVLGDYETGKIYAEHNADEVVGLASTSKLMAMYCILDAVDKGEISMKDQVTIGHEAASMNGSTYKTKEGEVYTVEELIHAGMIVSGNDAMISLAIHIAGSQEAFVARMNEKAKELGLTHAHFTNCHGLTDYGKNDYNQATAREMFELSRKLLKDFPYILKVTSREKIDEPQRQYLAYSTNPLLGILAPIDGLKTGYTGIAGRCFIATGAQVGQGHTRYTRFIGVYMGAENDMDRYAAALKLSKRALEYRSVYLCKKDEEVGTLKLKDASPNQSPVYAGKNLLYLKRDGDDIKRYVDFYDITAPHSRKEPVGRVRYVLKGKEIGRADVFVKEDIKHPNPILKYKDLMADIFRTMESAA